MKTLVASIYCRYKTVVADDSAKIHPFDGYHAGTEGTRLWLQFMHVEQTESLEKIHL